MCLTLAQIAQINLQEVCVPRNFLILVYSLIAHLVAHSLIHLYCGSFRLLLFFALVFLFLHLYP